LIQSTEYEKKLHYVKYGLAFDPTDVTQSSTIEPGLDLSTGIANHIYWIDENKTALIDQSGGPFVPTWQVSSL
jgi:hypothetical protein